MRYWRCYPENVVQDAMEEEGAKRLMRHSEFSSKLMSRLELQLQNSKHGYTHKRISKKKNQTNKEDFGRQRV